MSVITAFNPLTALGGGALIGVSAALLLLLLGRVAGISGILGGLLRPRTEGAVGVGWRLAFVVGLLAAPAVYAVLAPLPVPQIKASNLVLVAAGLLVGVGTRLGSGCTSGHGVCGLARFSPRSLAAVLVFMGVAAAVATLVGSL